ncbi:hypothetical protein APHNP_0262 [Anaplasma phagocytophilum str. ApNP]|uniref:Uncharacterized protein n=1 Tax=Anaplasma phagocytophilum str. ApNP TaxID=1359153 RepID=A0A0F3NGS2_ANAPH|nr:hypothetical protein APHNP_0262 [Anaplasma phagocytophilum str. ApNP]
MLYSIYVYPKMLRGICQCWLFDPGRQCLLIVVFEISSYDAISE